VVWLYPGIERVIPIAATSLGGLPMRPVTCRLSVASVQAVLAVVAFLTTPCQEDADVEPESAFRSRTDIPSTGAARLGTTIAPAATTTPATDCAAPDLWASLSPRQKTQIRQTILHILQEVLDDHPQP